MGEGHGEAGAGRVHKGPFLAEGNDAVASVNRSCGSTAASSSASAKLREYCATPSAPHTRHATMAALAG